MRDIQFFDLTFVEKQLEFESIYTLKFKPTQPLFFEAGQWVHLGIPTETRDKSMVRHMSFASAPDAEFIEFTMDLGSGSLYKNKMNTLQTGDTVKAFKINGEFVIDPIRTSLVVFISGGLGITPVRSIVRNLKNKGGNADWSLLHVSRSKFLYEEELSTFPHTQWRVNRAGIESVWSDVTQKADGALFYLSGSARFVEGITERLRASGISETQLRTESFK